MKRSIEKLRVEYGNTPLCDEDLSDDPIDQFEKWLDEAIRAEVMEPNAMTLATVSESGRPSARIVLLKEIDREAFLFYTSQTSRKGVQLAHNANGALTFWWRDIYRQVCVEGSVSKIGRSPARTYFAKRPRGAQLATLLSHQSEPLASRQELDEAFTRLKRTYRGKPIPCPTSWCGYRLIPDRIEFWQGRANRLHDRFVYIRTNGEWILTRLAP